MKNLYTRLLLIMLLISLCSSKIIAQQITHVNSPHFQIYYYETGPHAIDPTDNDGDQMEDYLEYTATYLEKAYSWYLDTLGLLKPPLDSSGFYNVFLVNFATLNYPAKLLGATNHKDSIGIDNPNSLSIVEPYASRSYIMLRNEYSGINSSFTESQLLQITATHEFFHVVQNGYNYKTSSFFHESLATFFADQICKTEYGMIFLKKFYDNPDLALNYDKKDESGTQRQYSSWIFWTFIQEHISIGVIKQFLEKSIYDLSKSDEMNSLQFVLAGRGTSLNAIFTDFCIANTIFSSNTTVYPKYSYKDASKYITAGILANKAEAILSYTSTPIIYKSIDYNKRLMRLSLDNFYLNKVNKKFTIKVRPSISTSDIEVIVLKQRETDQVYEIENINSRTINGLKEFWTNIDNPADYYSYSIIVKRFDRFVTDTLSLQYELEIGIPDPWTVFDISPYSTAGYGIASDIDIDPQNGNVWITGGAILRYDGRMHTVRDPYPFGGSWTGWAKFNNKDWFGYSNAGFSKYDGAFTDYTFNTDTNITAYSAEIISVGNTLWKAGDKIVNYDGSAFKKFGVNEGLPTDGFSDIAYAPTDGSIWVGTTDAGIGKYAGGSWSWYTTASGLPDNRIWAIDVSKQGVVWVGMPNGLLAKSTASGFVEVVNPDVTVGCTIPCIVEDIKTTPLENLWVGMRSNGVSYFNGLTWKNFNNINTGIPEMVGVHRIAVDGDSCVWFAMQKKVARYCYKTNKTAIATTKNNSDASLKIYPNPTNGTFSIQDISGIKKVEIYNINGELLQQVLNGFQEINIHQLIPGIYLVKIYKEQENYYLKKIIRL